MRDLDGQALIGNYGQANVSFQSKEDIRRLVVKALTVKGIAR